MATMPTAHAPTGLVVTPAANGESATVTWAAPASNGGSPVTGYELTRTGGTPVDLGLVGTHTWTGLTPGSAYTFTVAAKNAVGTGAPASQVATMPTAPTVPTSVVVTPAANGQSATVTWARTGLGRRQPGHRLHAHPHRRKPRRRRRRRHPHVDRAHPRHDVHVHGRRQERRRPRTPGQRLREPARQARRAGHHQGQERQARRQEDRQGVSWSAPASTGGTPITGYQVLVFKTGGAARQDASPWPLASTSYQAKLTGGKYRFAIVAVNAVGAGPQSALSKKVTAR